MYSVFRTLSNIFDVGFYKNNELQGSEYADDIHIQTDINNFIQT